MHRGELPDLESMLSSDRSPRGGGDNDNATLAMFTQQTGPAELSFDSDDD